jgi:hypothetical protein
MTQTPIDALAARISEQTISGIQAVGVVLTELILVLAEKHGLDKADLCARLRAMPELVEPEVNTEGFRLILGMLEGAISEQLHKRKPEGV